MKLRHSKGFSAKIQINKIAEIKTMKRLQAYRLLSTRSRQTGWFISGQHYRKALWRHRESFDQLRRRCAVSQIARRWNAKKKS
jgi:hypothetical protein